MKISLAATNRHIKTKSIETNIVESNFVEIKIVKTKNRHGGVPVKRHND